MFTPIHPQIEAARVGDNRSNTLYLIRHPQVLAPVERIPGTAVLLIGPVRPALAELLERTSRAEFQKLLPLSANAHHKLATAVLEEEPSEAAQLKKYGDLTLASTGDSTGRISLIFGREFPAIWEQASPAKLLLIGIDNKQLRDTLLEEGQAFRQALDLSVSTYTRLREHLGINSPPGRPCKPDEAAAS